MRMSTIALSSSESPAMEDRSMAPYSAHQRTRTSPPGPPVGREGRLDARLDADSELDPASDDSVAGARPGKFNVDGGSTDDSPCRFLRRRASSRASSLPASRGARPTPSHAPPALAPGARAGRNEPLRARATISESPSMSRSSSARSADSASARAAAASSSASESAWRTDAGARPAARSLPRRASASGRATIPVPPARPVGGAGRGRVRLFDLGSGLCE